MATLQSVKAAVSVADVRPDRIETAPVRQAVRPDLPPPKVVTAPPPTEQPLAARRELLSDPQSRDVIMRVMDESSRPAVNREPERALQRLRAYLRTEGLDQSRRPPISDLNT